MYNGFSFWTISVHIKSQHCISRSHDWCMKHLLWQYRTSCSWLPARQLFTVDTNFSLRTVSAKISILTSSSLKQVHLVNSQEGLIWNPKTICANKERSWLLASMPHGWPSRPLLLIILVESTATSPGWLVKISKSRWWNLFTAKFANGGKKETKPEIPKGMDKIYLPLHNEIHTLKVTTTVYSVGYLDHCCVPWWVRLGNDSYKNIYIIKWQISLYCHFYFQNTKDPNVLETSIC